MPLLQGPYEKHIIKNFLFAEVRPLQVIILLMQNSIIDKIIAPLATENNK